jgi:cell division protein FtsW
MVDKQLYIYITILIFIGVIFSYSLSVYTVERYGYEHMHFFIRQLITATISLFFIWVISRTNPDNSIRTIGFFLFFFSLLAMSAMPFLPESWVTSAGGAKRWIRLPGFSLAPVEFFKIGFVFFLAWSFSRKFSRKFTIGMDIKEEMKTLIPYFVIFALVVWLIAIMQNDLGQVVLLGMTLAIMMLLAGGHWKIFTGIISVAIIGAIVLIISAEHRIHRVMQWWATSQKFILSIMPDFISDSLRVDGLPEPYQISHSLNAINDGGLFGKMLGNGEFKYGFLTEVHTDFVLAGISEEFGLIGMLLIVFLFILILWRIFRIANRVDNFVHNLFCMGIGLVIIGAFLINAFGISGLTPVKGIAVPFLSYGGSSMLSMSIAIGMVLAISKKVKINKEAED